MNDKSNKKDVKFHCNTKKLYEREIRVRMTEKDRQRLEKSAILACLSMSEYVRKLICDNMEE